MSESTAERADDVTYRFVVGGEGCEVCQALDGTEWTEIPPPPHPHCECDLEVVQAGPQGPRQCGDNLWTIENTGTEPYGIDSFKWTFVVTIECWDGATTQYEDEVDFGSNSDWPNVDDIFEIWNEYAWNEMADRAEEVAAQFCKPCEEPLVA